MTHYKRICYFFSAISYILSLVYQLVLLLSGGWSSDGMDIGRKLCLTRCGGMFIEKTIDHDFP